jgi:hypothetical protein
MKKAYRHHFDRVTTQPSINHEKDHNEDQEVRAVPFSVVSRGRVTART